MSTEATFARRTAGALDAPDPNAARLFQSFLFSAEAQQLFVDGFAHRSFAGEGEAGTNAALGG
jgi:ABC-type Fe3+ transport system substrate-binding protein